MTTPLSKMVALLILSLLTPKRGLGSTGSLSEAKKGVAKVCGDRLSTAVDKGPPRCVFRGRPESPKDLQGLIKGDSDHCETGIDFGSGMKNLMFEQSLIRVCRQK